MDWCNHLLSRYGHEKWCVTVDPDEFLVFPLSSNAACAVLTRYMDGIDQPSLLAPLIDAYSGGRLSDARLTETSDPFELCPYFDRFNLTQRFDRSTQSFWIQGGVRLRRFFANRPESAPALNKVPLVRWDRRFRYVSSMHHLNHPEINCTVRGSPLAVSGVLFHFKYVNLLSEKANEEVAARPALCRQHRVQGLSRRRRRDPVRSRDFDPLSRQPATPGARASCRPEDGCADAVPERLPIG